MISRTLSHRIRASAALAAGLFIAALSPSALAQGFDLGPDLRQSVQLSGDQANAIETYIKDHSGNLSGSDPQLVKRDRAALLDPLGDQQASPAFRLKYSEYIIPRIKPLTEGASEIAAINALVIAGDLATAQGVELLTNAMASEKPALRYQAAYGLRRTFEALASMPSPTMRVDQVEDAVKRVTARLVEEGDPLVSDGLAMAGIQATRIASMRSIATAALCKAASAKTKALNGSLASDALAEALLRTAAGVRDTLSGAQAGQISGDALKSAAEFGGRVIAYCVRAVESKALPLSDPNSPQYTTREVHSQLATTGETIVLLATTLQGARAPESRKIGEKLKNATTASDVNFGEDARAIVGKDGLLARDPFKFAANTFLDK